MYNGHLIQNKSGTQFHIFHLPKMNKFLFEIIFFCDVYFDFRFIELTGSHPMDLNKMNRWRSK